MNKGWGVSWIALFDMPMNMEQTNSALNGKICWKWQVGSTSLHAEKEVHPVLTHNVIQYEEQEDALDRSPNFRLHKRK
ncbi:hypothetical protein QCA50_011611 [Cerrena zonata]|uniref:Uncharacterized protein n=1 Tax=Cerrena zonata TaxID=2478898 RepID=A0AAW0G5H9_9APHY